MHSLFYISTSIKHGIIQVKFIIKISVSMSKKFHNIISILILLINKHQCSFICALHNTQHFKCKLEKKKMETNAFHWNGPNNSAMWLTNDSYYAGADHNHFETKCDQQCVWIHFTMLKSRCVMDNIFTITVILILSLISLWQQIYAPKYACIDLNTISSTRKCSSTKGY